MSDLTTQGLDADLLKKIAHARDRSDRSHTERLASPATVAETLHAQAAARPDQDFLIFYDDAHHRRVRTYGAFYARVRIVARMMEETLGLKRGDRILTAMHNHDFTILITFAAWHLGLTVVPLNMGEDDKRLAYILEHAHAKTIFVLDDYRERMAPLIREAPNIRHAMLVGANYSNSIYQSFEREVSFFKISARELAEGPRGVAPDDEALIVYTSGTTGVPKGVVLSQYNLIADAHSITEWHAFEPGQKMMCVLPVHHVNGLIVTHVTPVFYGGTVVLNRKFHTSLFFKRIAQEEVRVVSVVPTLLQFLVEGLKEDVTAKDVPTLSHIICGAGPLTVDLSKRFEDRFGVPICHGYGLSESTCYSCFLPIPARQSDADHKGWMRDHGYPSIGVPVVANEMAIHDDDGKPVPEGQKGEIVIRGHNVTKAYANNPEANAKAFTHGWFRSGDEGFMKKGADGLEYYFISGRFKELIIRGGVKISPLEVDEVISKAPGVKAGMAVGFENTVYGEEVGAYVVAEEGASPTEESILAFCRQTLSPHACPKVVIFGDSFPVTSTGKYQRNKLKPQFEKWKDAQFK